MIGRMASGFGCEVARVRELSGLSVGAFGVTMQTWIAVFVIVAAAAIVLQAAILVAMFFQMRRTMERMERFTSDFKPRANPAGRYTAQNFRDGRGCLACSVSGASASAEGRSRVHRGVGPAARPASARGPHLNGRFRGGGGCGVEIYAQCLASGAESVRADAGD